MIIDSDGLNDTDDEEHYIFDGNPNRRISEAEGFKVYLCPEHHRTGREVVHTNHELMRLLQCDAQKEYEKDYTREEILMKKRKKERLERVFMAMTFAPGALGLFVATCNCGWYGVVVDAVMIPILIKILLEYKRNKYE